MSAYTVGILTISDTSSKDNTLDKSGPLLKDILTSSTTEAKYTITHQRVVPDEIFSIQEVICEWAQKGLNLVITTGGTGFSPRDVTPEAIKPLITRKTSGITHLLLSSSLNITPFAALSRPITGIRNETMIITLPGSPKACKENIQAVLKVLPHALDLLLDRKAPSKKLHEKIQQQVGDVDVDKSAAVAVGRGGHTCTHKHALTGHESQTGQSASLDTPVSRRARSSPYPLIHVDKALEIVSDHAKLLNVISVPVSQFLPGYVLAEDVVSLEPVPGYRASVVDGYAVHVEDGPGIYQIESISLASSADEPNRPLSRGKIARVATGGMVPVGANAVIMVEDTNLIKSSEDGKEELEVEILVSSVPFDNIREIGSDCLVGELVGKQGQRIGSELSSTLASVGVRHVKVYRKPRVGVLSSGNEVLDHIHTDSLKPGQIRDTNRITLLALIQQAGFEAVDLGIVDDQVDEIVERLEEATAKVDVLITTGGVSMGEADFMKPILEQKLDATIQFGRVLMKPGKPATFATIPQGPNRSEKLVFALPGNPVSATVTFHLFVLPALKKMSGWNKFENGQVPVKIQHDIRLDSRPEFHRVQVQFDRQDGSLTAESTGNQRSSRMLSMVEANGLLKLPERTPDLEVLRKGAIVPCIMIGGFF